MKNREICDQSPIVSNRNLLVTVTRLFIRILLNAKNKKFTIFFLCKLENLFLLARKSPIFSYMAYLSRINSFRFQYMTHLSESNFQLVLEVKSNWAQYVHSNSNSKPDIDNAYMYLDIIKKTISNNLKISNSSNIPNQKKLFHIFGPNISADLLDEDEESVLVVTKPLSRSLRGKNSLLFLNSIFYSTKVESDEVLKLALSKEYSRIYIKDKTKDLKEPYTHTKEPAMGNIASPMALGVILFNLLEEFGEIQCKIEGFDFYSKEASYSNNYQSLLKQSDNSINDEGLFLSLASHDPIFDFLYVKKFFLEKRIELIDSEEFSSIVSLSSYDYFLELTSARRFKPFS
jgi:hypothetical protein